MVEPWYTVHTGLYKSLYGSALPNPMSPCRALVIALQSLWVSFSPPSEQEKKQIMQLLAVSCSSLHNKQDTCIFVTFTSRQPSLCPCFMREKDPSKCVVLPAVPLFTRGSEGGI